jgi:hypothetical protein
MGGIVEAFIRGLPELTGLTAALMLLITLTLAIYIVIIVVFFYARRKYRGGLVEQVINLIIATIGFLLVSDMSLFLVPVYGLLIAYTVNVVFKIIAMITLAIGGLRFFVK